MKFSLLTTISLSLLISLSCNYTKKYNYYYGIKQYLADTFNIETTTQNERIYYFLPINNCNTCQSTYLNLKSLREINTNKNLSLIVIGNITENKNRFLLKEIKKNNRVLLDKNRKINDYQTGVLKPLLLHIKNGKCIYFLEITDFNIKKAKDYLLAN